MPIRRENRYFYPIDWRQLSEVIRFRRAGGRCEGCGRPHGETVRHLGDGRWWDDVVDAWRDGQGRKLRLGRLPRNASIQETRVYLACAHLDHDPGNNEPHNLKAFCQRCHILHDRVEHLRQRLLTYRMRKAAGDLFLGPYDRSTKVTASRTEMS